MEGDVQLEQALRESADQFALEEQLREFEPLPRAHFEQVLPGIAYRFAPEDLSSAEAFDNQGYTEEEILKISEIESNQDNDFTVISCLRKDLSDECIFCLDIPMRLEIVRRLRCMHVFHKECFDEYYDERNDQNNKCPICKGAVIPESNC